MILRLVREQLRTQWRYTAWSAALLAFALALAMYAMVTGATTLRFSDAYGPYSQKDHYASFSSVVGPGEVPDWAPAANVLSFEEVQSLVARASTETSVQASVGGFGSVSGSDEWLFVIAATPPIDWDRQLASGNPPEQGEIVVSQQTAEQYGLAIGDPFRLFTVDTRGPQRSSTFVVSGTVKAGTVAPYWSGDPGLAYVPWSDAEEVSIGLPNWRETDEAGTETLIISTSVSWDGDSGTLAPYELADYDPARPEDFSLGRALSRTDESGSWSLLAAGLAVLGMIVAAFGMGRAQAEARTTWAATARVLGASQRTIAISSVIETAIVSLVGIALGLATGVAAVALNLAVLRAAHPEALLPGAPSVPLPLILAGVAIGLVIAAVVATVPAFWTARVAPVAALKPVTPVGEATVSRDVSPWWPLAILGGTGMGWTVLFWVYERDAHSDWDVIAIVLRVTFVAVVVAACAVALEGSRRLVGAVGAVLSRSRKPWLVAAGDGLVAHRRTFTFASLSSLTLTAIFAWTATDSAIRAIDPLPSLVDWWRGDFQASGRAAGFGVIIAVATVVAVAVTLASRATFATDAATRAALGLTGAGERRAVWARQWAVMGAAAVMGGLLGWAARLLVRLGGAALSPNELVHSLHWNLTVAAYGLAGAALMIAVALAMTLAGSLLVGLLARPRTPVDALRRAAR